MNASQGRFVGVWRLEAIKDRSPGGRVADHPDFGPDPDGLLFYTETGRMSVQFMRRSRPAWSKEDDPADLERLEAARGYGSYAGRFEVDERLGAVHHHVEVALIPNRVGATLTRYFSFDGDRLTLEPPPLPTASGNVERCLTWRRVVPARP